MNTHSRIITPCPSSASPDPEFEALALSYHQDIYRIALKLTGNVDDAEDLTQEVYVRATRYAKNFRRGTDFRAWVITILRTAFIDDRRKKKRRLPSVDPEAIEQLLPSRGLQRSVERFARSHDPEDIRECFEDDMLEALLRLPGDFRQAFLLATVAGFTYEEIAEIMQCPDGTVRSRVFRSRRLLKQALQNPLRQRKAERVDARQGAPAPRYRRRVS